MCVRGKNIPTSWIRCDKIFTLSKGIVEVQRIMVYSCIGYAIDNHTNVKVQSMATGAVNEKKLRGIVKFALADAFKENLELMQDIVHEALEDIAIARAIEQGLETKPVSRKKVFSILEGGQ